LREVRPLAVLLLPGVRRPAVSSPPLAVCLEADRGAVVRPETAWSRPPPVALHPDALQVLTSAVLSSELLLARPPRAVSPLAMPKGRESLRVHRRLLARLAGAWRRGASPCVHRLAKWSWRRPVVLSWSQQEVSWVLPSAPDQEPGAQAVPRSGEAAAEVSDAEAVQPRAELAASVQQRVAEQAASAQRRAAAQEEGPAAAVVRHWVAAVSDAEVPQPVAAASGVEVPRQVAAVPVGEALRPVVAWRALQREAGPSAAPWAFRRDRALPWPARQRAARSAHAIRMSQAASPSERSWQAARCEGLS
jgi:hypothetical protein